MIKKIRSKHPRPYLLILVAVFITILIFTFFDFLIHSLSKEYAVPDYYFKNKIIYGTLIGFITYLFLKNKSIFTKALIFSSIVSVLLQIRYYFIEHYALNFVLEFLVIHFLILLPVSWFVFYFERKFEPHYKNIGN